jgi:hypothetical protein
MAHEAPKAGKREGVSVANDNHEGTHLRDVSELPGYERPKEERDEIHNKALREMMGEIKEAPKGAVMFIGGITSPRAWDERRSGVITRASAQGYDDSFAQRIGQKDVILVTHDSIYGSSGEYAHGLAAIEAAITDNPGKKIVIDSDLLLQKDLFTGWRAEDAKHFDALTTGKQSKHGLAEWLKDPEKIDPDADAVSKSSILEERFHATLEALSAFAKKPFMAGRELIVGGVNDNLLTLAFFSYAAKAHLDPRSQREALDKFEGEKTSTSFLRIMNANGKIQTRLGRKKFKARSI